ncbi:phosphatidate cytidylyltransferase [Microbacterium sp. p3-SID338]|uniref:phosphatidate cytidylyltransferase n=1 Tax=Microbacterium sp. p3-SID338 TaxID=2916214 RepID=UPI0007895D74|nr:MULTISPECIES: phosphatidate cytidylyltransferase [unclassified Microbacterium]KYJ99219.1 phosphatidate cytidylyltransferase [Microbacterium sp. CH1]MCT1394275.1 phosphatidate cytidylyltransferase [Microbacterium sp. p3-SID338]
MSDESRGAEEGTPATRRVTRSEAGPEAGVPLGDAAFPAFDADRVPPRPPLPATPPTVSAGAHRLDTADHSAIRDQWRQARDDFGTHVSHARDQLDQANERIKQRTGRDLVLAILIGLAFGAALLGSLLFVKALFVPFALAAALLGVYELSRALRAAGRRVDVIPQLVAAAFLVLSAYFAEPWLSWVMLFVSVAFVIVWRLLAQMVAKDGRTYGDVLTDAVIGGFVQVYVPFLAGVALILLEQEGGQWWVLSFIAIAVAADTGAYAAGLAFGRHPMAPRISPKKTWEGFGGAVVAALVVGVLLALFLLDLPWWGGVIFGAAILLSATLGDLGESMLKRDLGIKDMSSWLPGHGGLLDRLDSILLSTVPALCLYFLLSPWLVL